MNDTNFSKIEEKFLNAELVDETLPWDRLPNETSKAYNAFVTYYQMGVNRSIDKVAQELGKTSRHIEIWSSKYKWVSRARAYDNEQTKQVFDERREEHLQKINSYRDKTEKFAQISYQTSARLMARLHARLERLTDAELDTIPPDQLANCFKTVAFLAHTALENLGKSLAVDELMAALDIANNSKLRDKDE